MTRVAPAFVFTDRSPALEDAPRCGFGYVFIYYMASYGPDRAAAVAANALVDQLGRLELKPLEIGADGLVDT